MKCQKKLKKPQTQATKKRKRCHRKSYTSSIFSAMNIYKVLKQVHPDLGISNKAMSIVRSFLNDSAESITKEVANLVRHKKKAIVTDRDFEAGVKLYLSRVSELSKHAVSEGAKAVAKYKASMVKTTLLPKQNDLVMGDSSDSEQPVEQLNDQEVPGDMNQSSTPQSIDVVPDYVSSPSSSSTSSSTSPLDSAGPSSVTRTEECTRGSVTFPGNNNVEAEHQAVDHCHDVGLCGKCTEWLMTSKRLCPLCKQRIIEAFHPSDCRD